MDIDELFAKARFLAIRKYPYLASMVYNLIPVKTNKCSDGGQPTMAVDKWGRLYIHPEIGWTSSQMSSVLVHECWHMLRRHHSRFEGKNQRIANIAEDAAINDDLQSEKCDLPGDPILPETLGLQSGGIEEEYYDQLIKNSSKAVRVSSQHTPGSGGDCGSAASGDTREWEADSPGESGIRGITPVQMEGIARQVATAIREAGTGSDHMKKWADEILSPTIDPTRLLRAFVSSLTRPGVEDFSYSRPNRRSQDLMLPILRGREPPEVAFLIDTSGSMSEFDLALSLGVVQRALKGGAKVSVYVGDTELADSSRDVKTIMKVRGMLSGGGGTDMGVLIDDIAHNGRRVKGLIVLTDGYTPWGCAQPKFPVAILLTQEGSDIPPSWAKVIHLKDFLPK